MPDLVQKQLVAVIDRRTTVVCLHAAGQIQPVSEPFVTINGSYDRPPFHVHCRSLVTVWMPGFVNRYRAEANAELKTRSPAQRRLADGRVPSRIPKPPDPFGGLAVNPIGAPPSFPFTRMDDAVVRLLAKSDEPLEGLVGQFDLKDVIDRAPSRFTVVGNGGGMSETYWVTDLNTGRRYSMKAGSRNSGSLTEVVSTDLQERLGLRLSRSYFADGVSENGWTLTRHIEDVRPGAKVIGSGRTPAQMVKAARQMNDPASSVDTVLNDFLLDQTDRKSGNWLRLKVGQGEDWVPIDHDGSFLGHAGLGKQDLSLATRRSIDTIEGYVRQTGTPPKGFVDVARSVDADDVIRRYDQVVERASRIDIDDVLAGYRGARREIDGRLDEIADLWRARVAGLTDQRAENLRYLGVPDSKIVRLLDDLDAAADLAPRSTLTVLDEDDYWLDVRVDTNDGFSALGRISKESGWIGEIDAIEILEHSARLDPEVLVRFTNAREGFMAAPTGGAKEMFVSRRDVLTFDKFVEYRARDGGRMFMQEATDERWLEYLVTHEHGHLRHFFEPPKGGLEEMGHALSALTDGRWAWDEFQWNYQAYADLQQYGLSTYGTMNGAEAVAECHAAWVMSGQPIEVLMRERPVVAVIVRALGWA